MKKIKNNTEAILDKYASYAALIPAISLIIFMLMHAFLGILNFAHDISRMINTRDFGNFHPQSLIWLEVVATIIILLKAYKVLMSYVKNHHLMLKDLLEITFTASWLELLFNASKYELDMKIIFLVLGLSSILIYLIFYSKITSINELSHKKEDAIANFESFSQKNESNRIIRDIYWNRKKHVDSRDFF
ncbi:MAG: hypothetical protein KJ915_09350 [Candidatus Omnitrophica bacterium]|nr:hypothetical protein [Candidatus Omnitrophota bacterium]